MNISIDCNNTTYTNKDNIIITTTTMILNHRHHDNTNNNECHNIILDNNNNDKDDVMMDKNEKSMNDHNNDDKLVKVVVKEDHVHSLQLLSSSFHDDSRYTTINRCSSCDDDSSISSNDDSSCSSSVSCNSSNPSFARYDDYNDDHIIYDPLDAIENWSIDTSSSHDDDDDLSTTSYCSSASSSSEDEAELEINRFMNNCNNYSSSTSPAEDKLLTRIRDSLILLDHHCPNNNLSSSKCKNNKIHTDIQSQSIQKQQQLSLTKEKIKQHDVMMKQPWRSSNNNCYQNKHIDRNHHSLVAVDDKDDNNSVLLMDDNYKTNVININNCCNDKVRKHHVSFDLNIYVQEYNITVGAYASVDDTCPLQLTWEHTPIQIIPFNDGQKQRQKQQQQTHNECCQLSQSQWLPHRMNIKERRQRIATCNHITVHDVYMLEQQMILWQIQDALQHNHQIMIHCLHFQDNNDIDDNIETTTSTNNNGTHHDNANDDTNENTSSSLYQHQYQDVVWHKSNIKNSNSYDTNNKINNNKSNKEE